MKYDKFYCGRFKIPNRNNKTKLLGNDLTDTETLKTARKSIRSERRELKLRRWSADNDYNGNEIVEAYDLYMPGVDLNDNPKLSDKMSNIEKNAEMNFFEMASFEKDLLEFFATA
ncbi:hypothetical protein ACRYI5_10095 [Furfurilactobacillus sp. WILCCON 0119]